MMKNQRNSVEMITVGNRLVWKFQPNWFVFKCEGRVVDYAHCVVCRLGENRNKKKGRFSRVRWGKNEEGRRKPITIVCTCFCKEYKVFLENGRDQIRRKRLSRMIH